MSAVAKRYARAALAATADQAQQDAGSHVADTLSKDLRYFVELYAAQAHLREALHNPAFKQERRAILDAVLAKLALSKLATRLVRLLADNDRIDELQSIANEIEALADAQGKRLRAHVRSAIALDDQQVSRIAKALEKRMGQPVTVDVDVDPELLGGLVCKVGDLTLDSSLHRQLEILTERLGAHAS